MNMQDAPGDLVREIEAVLGRRVDELEHENGRLRRQVQRLGIGVAVALLAAAALGGLMLAHRAGVADKVQAHQFVLRDANGHVRAVLGSTAEGGARLSMQDVEGRDRLRMTLLADGSPGLSFADAAGRSRAVFALLPDETANLVFADPTGRTRAVFGLMPDGSSTLVFADRAGVTRVGVGVDHEGGAGLTIFERDDAPRATAEDAVPDTVADTTMAGQR